MDPSDHLPTFIEQVKRTFAADNLGEWTSKIEGQSLENRFVLLWDAKVSSMQVLQAIKPLNGEINTDKVIIASE